MGLASAVDYKNMPLSVLRALKGDQVMHAEFDEIQEREAFQKDLDSQLPTHRIITIPKDPTPQQITELLAYCGNVIPRLVSLAGSKQREVAKKERLHKLALSKAIADKKGAGTQAMIKAMAESSPLVIHAAEQLEQAKDEYKKIQDDIGALETQHVTLRKIANLAETELNNMPR